MGYVSLQGDQRSHQQLEDTQGAFALKVVLSEETLASWLLQVHAPYICEPLCKLLLSFLLWCNYEVNYLKSVKVKTDKPGELKSDFTFISLSWPFLHAANGSHGLCGVLLVVGFLPAVLHGGLCLLLWFRQKWSQILYAGSCLPLENKIWNHS